ncbi:MAG TPA: hypothetical protein VGD68_10715, partial [Streptosporangiaceae bacterium]
PGRGAEVAVLVAANLIATVLRFVLFRNWVFRRPGTAVPAPVPVPAPAVPSSSTTLPDGSLS